MDFRRTLRGGVARLEQRSVKTEMPKLVVVCDTVGAERRVLVAPGTRIVTDWYNDVDGYLSVRAVAPRKAGS